MGKVCHPPVALATDLVRRRLGTLDLSAARRQDQKRTRGSEPPAPSALLAALRQYRVILHRHGPPPGTVHVRPASDDRHGSGCRRAGPGARLLESGDPDPPLVARESPAPDQCDVVGADPNGRAILRACCLGDRRSRVMPPTVGRSPGLGSRSSFGLVPRRGLADTPCGTFICRHSLAADRCSIVRGCSRHPTHLWSPAAPQLQATVTAAGSVSFHPTWSYGTSWRTPAYGEWRQAGTIPSSVLLSRRPRGGARSRLWHPVVREGAAARIPSRESKSAPRIQRKVSLRGNWRAEGGR
ncbi:MAG: hypothetical protein QOG59_2077 [Solirubrobacteraceae bacterium]|nr:hypothetical protein [Solirubrobacteraceae bacterium]